MTDPTRAFQAYLERAYKMDCPSTRGSLSEVLAMVVADVEIFGDAKIRAAVERTLEIAGRSAAE